MSRTRGALTYALGLGMALAPTGTGAQARSSGQADPSGEILAKAATAYEGTRSLCADFTQTLVVPLLREEKSGRGRLCQAQPDRFAMRFSEPDGDAVVVDGTFIWIYYPSLDPRQVLRLPVTAGAGGLDLHREFLSDPGTKYASEYRGVERVGAHEAHAIRLVPRTSASYASATVWIDSGVPVLRQVRIEEENGNIRTVMLEHVKTNVDIPAGFFRFTPPPGAQVIRR